jgi:hypothetical protein
MTRRRRVGDGRSEADIIGTIEQRRGGAAGSRRVFGGLSVCPVRQIEPGTSSRTLGIREPSPAFFALASRGFVRGATAKKKKAKILRHKRTVPAKKQDRRQNKYNGQKLTRQKGIPAKKKNKKHQKNPGKKPQTGIGFPFFLPGDSRGLMPTGP